ncbi:MAG TPA: MGMT family protein [Solirubrobacterales bacterium]|nr:MGMT family protein [Solirubrobacterales bacterium]
MTAAAAGMSAFETRLGSCAIAWRGPLVAATALPRADAELAVAGLRRRFADAPLAAPPAAVSTVVDDIVALLSGEPRRLDEADLDWSRVGAFERRIYEAARLIEPGATLTYGELAAFAGAPGRAREVGAALGRNPFPLVVPCHRVVAADGRIGGFSAAGGRETKRRLLEIEGAAIAAQQPLFR